MTVENNWIERILVESDKYKNKTSFHKHGAWEEYKQLLREELSTVPLTILFEIYISMKDD